MEFSLQALSLSARLPFFGPFFFLISLHYLPLLLLVHFCFPLSGSPVTLPPAAWWPVSITQSCALFSTSSWLEFVVPILTRWLPMVNLFAIKINQAEAKGGARPCETQLSCPACRSSCFCIMAKAQALKFLLCCWLEIKKD